MYGNRFSVMLKNGMKMFEILILKAMHYNLIVIQVLCRVCNDTFMTLNLYTVRHGGKGALSFTHIVTYNICLHTSRAWVAQ